MVEVRLLTTQDIQPIAAAFAKLGWNKPEEQYKRYLTEQEIGERLVLVATVFNEFAGYTTILWESKYPPFGDAKIPEIVDFNVLPGYRRKGIGTQLLDEAERRIAYCSPIAGIGVGLTKDYGAAHILYVKRGYIPDGRGICWHKKFCEYGDQVLVDDDLSIHFTKQLN